MNYFPITLLFLGGLILTIGDLIMKKWVISDSKPLFVFGLAVYLVGLIFLAQSFKYKNIAAASTIFVVFNVLTLSLASWLYFKETLSGFQMLGIILGLCSVIFIELG